MELAGIQPGDVLCYWYDAGIEWHYSYVKVVKVGKKWVQVRWEKRLGTSEPRWRHPKMFDHKVTDPDVLCDLRF